MSNSIVDVLLNKIDTVQLVNEYTELTEDRRGVYRGCCPVHHGGNPTSFVVLDDKIAYCHSCGFTGDAISLYCELEGLPFYAGVESLAEKYNCNLENNQQYQSQKAIVKNNTLMMNKFQKNISHVEDYLIKERNFSKETIEEFQLGYCDNAHFLESSKNPLTQYTGLIFPIHDIYGRCVGFSKRRLDGNTKPTYVNSYDDDVFEKSNTLYNLNRARKRLHDKKKLIICEGYCDTISAHQQGNACVGYIGGYLLKGQIELLVNISKTMPQVEFIFAPDNPQIDPTGAKEMIRIREKLLKYAPQLISKSRFIVYPDEIHKDFNDLHKDNIQIDSLSTEGIDKAVLRLMLNETDNIESEYAVVESFIQSVKNQMVKADIAKELSERWNQDLSTVRKFISVSEDCKADEVINEFKDVGESMSKLMKTLDVTTYGIGFPMIDYSFGGMQKKEVILIGAYSKIGKCISEDSYIKVESGAKQLKNINVNDRVVTFNEQSNKLEYGTVLRKVDTGYKQGYKVSLKSGKSVIVSKDHPFLTPNGWVKIIDGLLVGDQVAVPSYLPNEEASNISMQDIELLALMISDGSCGHNNIQYTKNDEYMINILENVCKLYGTTLSKQNSRYSFLVRNPQTSGILETLSKYNILGCRSYEKFIPEEVFKASHEKQKRFIELLFSGDGWVEESDFGFSTSSKKLSEDIVDLLLIHGIICSTRTKQTFYTKNGEKKQCRTAYVISISGKNARLFNEKFKLSPAKNQDKMTGVCAKNHFTNIKINNQTTKKIMDFYKGEHKKINSIVNKPIYAGRKGYVVPKNFTDKGFPKEKYKALYDATGIEELKHLSSDDLNFERIVAIEEVGNVHMYDLEVSNGHNFVANNILVHNTDLLCEIILHSVIRLKMNCIVFSMEMDRAAFTRRLLCKAFNMNRRQLSDALLSPDSAEYIYKAKDMFDKYLIIDDVNNLSIDDIKYRVSVANEKMFDKPADRVFVDYFQYLRGADDFDGIEKTAKSMKPFVKDLDCELYMLSQFSRNDRPWTTPSIASFKGGNSMESSFDKAILMWRPSKNPDLSIIDREAIKYQTMIRLESREEMYGGDTFELVYNPVTTRLEEKAIGA